MPKVPFEMLHVVALKDQEDFLMVLIYGVFVECIVGICGQSILL